MCEQIESADIHLQKVDILSTLVNIDDTKVDTMSTSGA